MASGKLPFKAKPIIGVTGEITHNPQRSSLYHQIKKGLTYRHYQNIKNYSAGEF